MLRNHITASFLIVLLFLTGISQILAVSYEVPPVCTRRVGDFSALVYWADSQQCTYGACSSNNGLEFSSAQIIAATKYLPCAGNCRASDCRGPALVPNPQYYLTATHQLILSGDIGPEHGYYISTYGGPFIDEPGTYEIISGDESDDYSITVLPMDRNGSSGKCERKDAKINFTHIGFIQNTHSSGCTCYWDGSTKIACNGEDCVVWKDPNKPIFKVKGSFIITKNEREDFNLFNVLFPPDAALEGLCYIKPIYYQSDEKPFASSYDRGKWNYQTCSCDPNIITQHYGGYVEDRHDYRVKVPGWEKDVWAYGSELPDYMRQEGWGYNRGYNYINLSLGSFGTLYFHCNTASDDSETPIYLLSSIEYCEYGEAAGAGETKWRFAYAEDANGEKHLSHIYNGTDPNIPENSEKYYSVAWSDKYTTATQNYYNTQIDSDSPIRTWQVSFDSEGRVVESQSGCSSGCGGSSYGYNKLLYTDDYEGYDRLVDKKYNSEGDIVLDTDYKTLRYGDYWPPSECRVYNSSFEIPDVEWGYFQQKAPEKWINNNSVLIYEPNDLQWTARYDAGESIPDGSQIVTLLGGSIQQTIEDVGVVADTTYVLEVDTGAFIDMNTSEVTIKLIVYDPDNPVDEETVASVDVDENTPPSGFGVQLEEGQWTIQQALWDSSDYPELSDWAFKLDIAGNYVDIDNVYLTSVTFLGNETKPLIVSQKAEPSSPSEPNVLFVTWDYNTNDYTAIERRWVDNQNARMTKYSYEDGTFGQITAKTEYDSLNEDPANPNGSSYTTYYTSEVVGSGADAVVTQETLYPSGKYKEVEKLVHGRVVESYTEDIKTGKKINLQSFTYTYNGDVQTHTDARGAVTNYFYDGPGLMSRQEEPETAAGQRVMKYRYDDADRIEYEEHQDSEGNWIRTIYNYNETTGFLDSVVVDDDINVYGFVIYEGKKVTTSYIYNDFGQVIREISPDGVVIGKSYGLGGELKSDFVIASGCNPNLPNPNLVLVSQTWYQYDNDGRVEYIKKVKSDSTFAYGNPEDAGDTLEWVSTQYVYDFLGRKEAVIEDVDGLALRTDYEYNNQGEVTKVTLPNGKWTETYRNGRGMVIMQIVGHDDLDSDKWQVTEYEYNSDGNLYKQTAPDETVTVYEYDNFGRLKKTKRSVTG